MDENKNFDKVDELLESTSAENRVKFNLSDIKSTETELVLDSPFGIAEEVSGAPVAPEVPSAPVEQEAPPAMPFASVAPEAPMPDMNSQAVPPFTSYQPPVAPAYVPEEEQAAPKKKAKKEKAPKQKNKAKQVKILQGIIIAVVALATAWTVMYTVDHTLAAQGYSPAFSISQTVYDDDSHSYTCLGYKVQFMYDANGNLTQKCVPFWEDGPNDLRYNNGELFEVTE